MDEDATSDRPQESLALSSAAFQARCALDEALNRLAELSESEIVGVLDDGPLERLVRLVAPPHAEVRREGELLYDYLLRHKTGLALLARLRRAINDHYSL